MYLVPVVMDMLNGGYFRVSGFDCNHFFCELMLGCDFVVFMFED